jgi:hypothetical protein
MCIDSPGLAPSTDPSTPKGFQPLSKAGPKKRQNVNKKKRTTTILTDTSDKNTFKESKTQVRKTGFKEREKITVCNIS